MHLIFDVLHLYYLPQYLPVYHQLIKQNAGHATFVFYHGIHDEIIQSIIEQEQLNHLWVENEEQALAFYQSQAADWIFFANSFSYLDDVHQMSKSVQLGHGIGPKSCYYTCSGTATTVRFVEGEYRTQRLKSMYPDATFVNVGYCKLDPIINNALIDFDLEEHQLDPTKKTILYAPTFYPSSIECFPKDWPKAFEQYNIIIKPHYFSLSKEKYKSQQALLLHWQQYDNVYLADVHDYSLIPFMATADLLISDASSALFEFAALNKPVIWCDFLKLRWSYRGIFSYRFKKRMDQDYGEYADIAVHAKTYTELVTLVDEQISSPKQLEKTRLSFAEKLAGKLDGKASERIVNYLVDSVKK
ncbi:CDP-glycerol glycerophosphotransferase family protein [Thalassotalea sp. 1_MG-2023]|uniref:CDP-glycerol glycerophosphotransferase family protein n=1 Tax=Thalassotalea sp. 1_MG-2023 TaxID=3062680 RepID=UPI0026E28EC7|nr:CDP-glycerol glycerophosphotransferase family protein [Thalassotalea sp. 1_MG-2023]MDO6428078.1 CDP-glycerol glycerophosphotransferase family protein [Thalassotalea sp. 1_MG-2023]